MVRNNIFLIFLTILLLFSCVACNKNNNIVSTNFLSDNVLENKVAEYDFPVDELGFPQEELIEINGQYFKLNNVFSKDVKSQTIEIEKTNSLHIAVVSVAEGFWNVSSNNKISIKESFAYCDKSKKNTDYYGSETTIILFDLTINNEEEIQMTFNYSEDKFSLIIKLI